MINGLKKIRMLDLGFKNPNILPPWFVIKKGKDEIPGVATYIRRPIYSTVALERHHYPSIVS